MPDALPTVKVDWNADGDFSDSGEDISGRVASFNLRRSIDPGKHFANNDTLLLNCYNEDKELSPENSSGSLFAFLSKANRVVQVAIQGVTQFTGLIEDIQPAPLKNGRRTADIRAVGLKKLLDQGEYYPRVFKDKRIDEIASIFVQELPVIVPGLAEAVPVGSLIVGTSPLVSLADLAILQKGYTSFPYAGDNLHGRNADMSDRFFYEPGGNKDLKVTTKWEFLKDLIEAEGGLLYFGADGKLVVRNRYWLASQQVTIDYTYDNANFYDGEYLTPLNIAEFYNRIDIKYTPRAEASTQTTVWTSKEDYVVPRGGAAVVEIIYDEEASATDIAVGSSTVTASDGLTSLTFELLRGNAQRARIKITNPDTSAAKTALAGTLTLAGNAISINSGVVTVRDEDSILDIGEKPLAKTIRGLATHAEASDLADFLLQWHGDNSARFASLTTRGLNPDASHRTVAVDIGDRIRVVDDQTSNDSEYHVFGKEVSYNADLATQVDVVLTLQKATNTQVVRYGSDNQNVDVSLRESGGADKLSQSFTVSRACDISRVRLWLRTVDSPAGTMTLKIETDSGGDPSGTAVTNGTANTVNEDDTDVITSGYNWVEFAFATAPSLSASTTYHLVLSTDRAAHASNYIEWGADDQRQSLHDALLEAWTFDDDTSIGASWTGNNDLTTNGTPTSQLGWQKEPDLHKPYSEAGIAGRGIYFDGTNEYLDITDNAALSLETDMAFCLWISPDELAGTLQAIVSKRYTSGQFGYELRLNTSNQFEFAVSNNGTAEVTVTDTTTLITGRRYFVYVYHNDGVEIGISVNDNTPTTTAHTTGIFNGTDDFAVGARADASAGFEGMVDELFLFDVLPTTAEVSFLHNGGAGRQLDEILGYINGEMKSESGAAWSAETKDACMEVYAS